MDYRNNFDLFREVGFDIKEGADMVMVKPGLVYLDIINKIKNSFNIPVIAYQVSGEYSLIKNGIDQKLLEKRQLLRALWFLKELEHVQ